MFAKIDSYLLGIPFKNKNHHEIEELGVLLEEEIDTDDEDSELADKNAGVSVEEKIRYSLKQFGATYHRNSSDYHSFVNDCLSNQICSLNACLFRYGQKTSLHDFIRQFSTIINDTTISTKFAIAFSFGLTLDGEKQVLYSNCLNSPSSKAYPFFLSRIAANLQLKDPAEMHESCYRAVIYNNLQHAKKQFGLNVSALTGNSILNFLFEKISKINEFVSSPRFTQKLDENEIRCEFYCSIAHTSEISSLQANLKRSVLQKI